MNRLLLSCTLLLILATTADLEAQNPGVPQWTRGIVWYQIVIDRFANGNPGNDPRGAEVLGDTLYQWEVSKWTSNWFDLSIQEKLYNENFYPNAYLRQYGGDFQGIRDRLGYLKALGVDALMLTPIFSATSSHKYDANSLHHACRSFGTRDDSDTALTNREVPEDPATWAMTASDRDFAALVKSVHDSGLKVIADAQFVHVSPGFWAFSDVLKNQEKSRYGPWFVVREWDKAETPFASEFAYESMWGVKAFPKFRTDTLGLVSGPKEYVFAATKKWMDPNGDGDPADGVDGWRIVLASELPARFWDEWCAHVKAINPNAITIAEWPDDGAQSGTSPPKCFDIVYTKRFARGLSGALVTQALYPTQFDELVYQNMKSARDPDVCINPVGDLETDRLASQCENPGVRFEQGNTPQRNPDYVVRKPSPEARRLQAQALAMQFTMLGSPMIYYGDEAGMWGADDPGCRKPMLWPEMRFEPEQSFSINGEAGKDPVAIDSSVFGMYKTLIQLRQDHLALRFGTMQTLVIDDVKRLYAFKRESGTDKVWVFMNGADEAQQITFPMREFPNGTRLRDVLHGVDFYVSGGRFSAVVPPRTVGVIVPYW